MEYLAGIFTLRGLTIPAFFYLSYVPMIYVPAFLVYAQYPGAPANAYLLGVGSVLFTVPLGLLCANEVARFSKVEALAYFRSPVTDRPPPRRVFGLYAIVLGFCALTVFGYFAVVSTIPLLEMFSGPRDPTALTLAREDAFKLLDPRWGAAKSSRLFYLYLFLRTLIFPVLILVAMGYSLLTKAGKWWMLFWAALLLGGFYAASSLSRAPLAAILMRIFFFLCLFNRGRIRLRTAAAFLLAMSAFPILVTTLAYSTEYSLLDGLRAVVLRLTYTPAEDLYYYYEIFPAVHDYLYGGTLVKPFLKVLEMEYFYIENYVYLYMSHGVVFSGHANAAFISNLHADFGLPGVLLGGVLVGFCVQCLQIYLCRKPKTILNMTLYAFLMYGVWVLNFGSVTSVLFVNGVIPVFILVWLIRVVGGTRTTVRRAAQWDSCWRATQLRSVFGGVVRRTG